MTKRRRTAVSLKPETYGQTVDAFAIGPDFKEWSVAFHSNPDPDQVLSYFKKEELYFGPPDVYAKLGF